MDSKGSLKIYLRNFCLPFNMLLEAWFDRKINELEAIDPISVPVAESIKQFTMNGGKRIRPALVCLGYQTAGDTDQLDRIFQAGIGMELLHGFFLIHDDIMDRSDRRRGQPTVHRSLDRLFGADVCAVPASEREHFVTSLGILAGDLCCAMGYEALTRSDFPPDRILSALTLMHSMVDATVIGQVLDLLRPFQSRITESDIDKIHILKTAKYTLAGPMTLGMRLAGANQLRIDAMMRYALPIGQAFQIQDDILGVFGSEQELGKPVTSDLEEGKRTLLTWYVEEHGTPEQRQQLHRLLGHQLHPANIETGRELFRDSGALDYSQKKARRLVDEGKAALGYLMMPAHVRDVLIDLADFVVSRTV